ncbi:YdcF family protein [Chelativorans sp. Marseille-P2723]|uniref:YdcF family protein n=1 Tax=Chelativorans sp. Marseille-P2723 TaxID=2709133 RepID=UPI00157037E2|nr:YdcF family protein [Chelativorans sp. Marseille-P2723]
MFHFASAIFWTLAQPVNLAALLIASSVAAGFLQWRKTALASGCLSVLVLFLSGWTTLGALLLHPLEERLQGPVPPPERVDGIVVLGGGFEGAINLARGGYELNASGDRFVETAILARRYPQARVLVSGGSGSVFLDGEGDADTAPRLLEALGVAPERIQIENRSRDTFENARFSLAIARPQPGETWLLVTSAFHMPRAICVFRKAGFPVVAWPTDYKTSGRERAGLAEDNTLDSIRNVTVAMREWLALAAYRVSGRSDCILPSSRTG